jgi:hypothetical protein
MWFADEARELPLTPLDEGLVGDGLGLDSDSAGLGDCGGGATVSARLSWM